MKKFLKIEFLGLPLLCLLVLIADGVLMLAIFYNLAFSNVDNPALTVLVVAALIIASNISIIWYKYQLREGITPALRVATTVGNIILIALAGFVWVMVEALLGDYGQRALLQIVPVVGAIALTLALNILLIQEDVYTP